MTLTENWRILDLFLFIANIEITQLHIKMLQFLKNIHL